MTNAGARRSIHVVNALHFCLPRCQVGRPLALLLLRSRNTERLLAHALTRNDTQLDGDAVAAADHGDLEVLRTARRLLLHLPATAGASNDVAGAAGDGLAESLEALRSETSEPELHAWDVRHFIMHALHRLGFAITHKQVAITGDTDVGAASGEVYALSRLSSGFFPVRDVDVAAPKPGWVQAMSIGIWIFAGTLLMGLVLGFGSGVIPLNPHPQGHQPTVPRHVKYKL